jgi:hypothetical protein
MEYTEKEIKEIINDRDMSIDCFNELIKEIKDLEARIIRFQSIQLQSERTVYCLKEFNKISKKIVKLLDT